MNCCKPEMMGTQGHAKMLKIIQVLEDGRVPAKEARNWRIEGQKKITRKEYQSLLNKVEMEGLMAQKRIVEIMWERGALPKEEGDAIRDYKAMHEEKFLSGWLREDGREKERKKRMERRVSNGDVTFSFLWRLLISSVKGVVVFLGRDLVETPEGLADREPETRVDVLVVPDATGVPVSPSSVVTEFCDGFSCCSDWEFVDGSPFLSPNSVLILVQVRTKR